jgi:hypothetical protein
MTEWCKSKKSCQENILTGLLYFECKIYYSSFLAAAFFAGAFFSAGSFLAAGAFFGFYSTTFSSLASAAAGAKSVTKPLA